MAGRVWGPVANFTEDLKPVTIEGLAGFPGGKMILSVQQARRLRDSLNIVISELEGTVFDRADE